MRVITSTIVRGKTFGWSPSEIVGRTNFVIQTGRRQPPCVPSHLARYYWSQVSKTGNSGIMEFGQ
jgi:hypothetical protein